MGNNAGWPLGPMWLWGLGPWGINDAPPPDVHPVGTVVGPINLRPGYVVTVVKAYYSINGTPYHPAADVVTLTDEGYYEVDVSDSAVGDGFIRHPIAIVDSSKLTAGISTPGAGAPSPSFLRLSSVLAPAYPRGRAIPFASNRPYVANVSTNRAVVLDIRQKDASGAYVSIGQALAKKPGVSSSGNFSLARGPADLKLAVVYADQNIVLG